MSVSQTRWWQMDKVSDWLSGPAKAYVWANRVSQVSGIPIEEMYSRARQPEVCKARHLFWAMLRSEGWSFPRIGKETGHDHTTVHQGVSNVPVEVVEEFRGNFI